MAVRQTMETKVANGALDGLPMLVGLAAVFFSALYFASDLIELAHGGFSTRQLVLTYVAEAAIPLFVIGLFAVQRPRIGWLGLIGAIGYAYSFIFFTGTVTFALVNHTKDWNVLVGQMSPWVNIHGAVMVLAGLSFGAATIRARVLPRWTGAVLMAGVVLVALSSGLPELVQTTSAGVRDLAFAGMGASLVFHRDGRRRGGRRTPSPKDPGSTLDVGLPSSNAGRDARSLIPGRSSERGVA
jgi:hypothetical protein